MRETKTENREAGKTSYFKKIHIKMKSNRKEKIAL